MEKHQYSVKKLQAVKDWLKDHPDGHIPTGRWTNPTMNRQQWNEWFIKCLHEKINRNESPRGRKDNSDWFWEIKRASYQINHARLIIDWLPKDLKSRFSYRLREVETNNGGNHENSHHRAA